MVPNFDIEEDKNGNTDPDCVTSSLSGSSLYDTPNVDLFLCHLLGPGWHVERREYFWSSRIMKRDGFLSFENGKTYELRHLGKGQPYTQGKPFFSIVLRVKGGLRSANTKNAHSCINNLWPDL